MQGLRQKADAAILALGLATALLSLIGTMGAALTLGARRGSVLLPLLVGAALAPLTQGWHRLKYWLSYASVLALLATAVARADGNSGEGLGRVRKEGEEGH